MPLSGLKVDRAKVGLTWKSGVFSDFENSRTSRRRKGVSMSTNTETSSKCSVYHLPDERFFTSYLFRPAGEERQGTRSRFKALITTWLPSLPRLSRLFLRLFSVRNLYPRSLNFVLTLIFAPFYDRQKYFFEVINFY